MRISTLFYTAILTAFLTAPAYAQGAPGASAPPAMSGPMSSAPAGQPADAQQQARLAKAMAGNPNAQKLQDMARNLYNTMTQAEDQRLVQLRTGFGMVRAAQTAKDDVGMTVALCDKANPSMKDEMNTHFAAWQSKVMPVVAQQEQAMQDSINNRNFQKPQDVRDFLTQLDKFATYAREQNDRNLTPDTKPDACKNLVNSMDRTSANIVDALHKITWPGQAG